MNATPWHWQANNDGNRLQGSVAEFMIFDKEFSPAERTTVQNYLNQRWSLW